MFSPPSSVKTRKRSRHAALWGLAALGRAQRPSDKRPQARLGGLDAFGCSHGVKNVTQRSVPLRLIHSRDASGAPLERPQRQILVIC